MSQVNYQIIFALFGLKCSFLLFFQIAFYLIK